MPQNQSFKCKFNIIIYYDACAPGGDSKRLSCTAADAIYRICSCARVKVNINNIYSSFPNLILTVCMLMKRDDSILYDSLFLCGFGGFVLTQLLKHLFSNFNQICLHKSIICIILNNNILLNLFIQHFSHKWQYKMVCIDIFIVIHFNIGITLLKNTVSHKLQYEF